MISQTTAIFYRLKNVVSDTQRHIDEAQLFITASSLAYTTILSMIPLLALSFVVFKAFGGLEKVYQTLEPIILSNLAEGASEDVMGKLQGFIENVHGSTVGLGGFLGLVFTSMSMLMSIENAFNRIWRVPNRRTWFQRVSAYWLFITLGPLAISIGLGIATSSNFPLSKILPGGSGIFVLTSLFLFVIYKVVPNTLVNWKYALISGFWTAVLFNLTRLAYNFYIDHYASYNKIYGSLAAIPIVLFWIYLMWLIVLGGAAFTAALQRRLEERLEAAAAAATGHRLPDGS